LRSELIAAQEKKRKGEIDEREFINEKNRISTAAKNGNIMQIWGEIESAVSKVVVAQQQAVYDETREIATFRFN
jgi:hypothetical protein